MADRPITRAPGVKVVGGHWGYGPSGLLGLIVLILLVLLLMGTVPWGYYP